jgi:AcrR family transcriptional regulator
VARPSDKQLDAAINRATLERLGEVGFDALTIGQVATRAETTRSAIYRRWPDKTALVTGAVRHLLSTPAGAVEEDTGSLRSDLLTQARGLAARLASEMAILAGLLTALRENSEIGALVRWVIIERDRHIMGVLIERAVARGELRTTAVHELVSTVPASMMFAQILLFNGELTDDYLTRLMDHVVLPLFTPYLAVRVLAGTPTGQEGPGRGSASGGRRPPPAPCR